MILVSDYKSSKVVQPGEEALYLPSALITPQHSTVLGSWLLSIYFVWSDQLRTMYLPKTLVQWIAVICLVTNYTLRCFFDEAAINGGFNQLYFVG